MECLEARAAGHVKKPTGDRAVLDARSILVVHSLAQRSLDVLHQEVLQRAGRRHVGAGKRQGRRSGSGGQRRRLRRAPARHSWGR